MNYTEHFKENMKVAIRCFVLCLFHFIHAIVPCDYTGHDYWGI